jgi:ribosomal protein S18 acetylase RimI-like enzyme
MLVESAKPADVASIVAIHCDALPHDVLPSLGPVFLYDFYSLAMKQPGQHLAVAREGDRVEGFCLLSLRPISVTRLLRPKHLAALVKVGIVRPRHVVSAIVQMRKPTVSDWDVAAEIAFIAVDPRMTGRGIGQVLMDDAASVARQNGRRQVATKTANTRLVQHYVRVHGARIKTTFRAGGRAYSVLEWSASGGGDDHITSSNGADGPTAPIASK